MTTFYFTVLNAPPITAPKPVIKVFDRAGVDGHAWREEAKKSQPVVWDTMETCTSVDTAKTRPEDYAALIGKYQYFTDGSGREVQCLVLDVTVTRIQTTALSSSGAEALVFASWTLIIPEAVTEQ